MSVKEYAIQMIDRMMKVQVLMSVYNSVHFFREQLDSVLAQVGVECNLLIRDDGSNNSDMDMIIQEYQKRYPERISYYKGENLGPAYSFLDLLQKSEDEYNYYAFCDHDDLWDEDKIYCAVQHLEEMTQSEPNCYFCNFRTCGVDGIDFGISNIPKDFVADSGNILLANPAPGCCMVINRRSRDIVCQRPVPKTLVMHDNWLILICSMLGHVFYDQIPHISYRQHGNNAVGVAVNLQQKLKFKLSYLRNSKNIGIHAKQAREFERLYGDMKIDKNKQSLLNLLCGYDQSIMSRLKLVFSNKLKSYNWKMTAYFKLAILLNRW